MINLQHREKKIFHTVVYPHETLYNAIIRAGVEAGKNGFDCYCIDCEICGRAIKDHHNEDVAAKCKMLARLNQRIGMEIEEERIKK